ncbi:MAG: hypothetical protein KatS3mg131_0661 [Candidatus Tectimicrobiota bacterium]|nr:MAG: hypothetical protein KatS3mg131_0661 [Candidatus Tectomicrobia bacterium]
MSTHEPLERAARRLRRRALLVRRVACALDVLLAGSGAGVVVTAGMVLAGWPLSPLLVYGGLLGLAGLVFLGLAWRMRADALPVLARADCVLRLHERLSTAYEYLQRAPAHPFLTALLAEANRQAAQVDPRLVFPLRVPRRAWGVVPCLGALVALAVLPIGPVRFFDNLAAEQAAQEVVREGQRLERWGRRLEELARREQLERSLLLARHLQQLGRGLQQQEGESKAAATERVSSLQQYLERMQHELRQRALLSSPGAVVAQEVFVSRQSLKQELQQLLQLLQHETLPREVLSVAEQGILRLSRQAGEHSAEFERLLEDLRAGNLAAARRLLEEIVQRQQVLEELEHLERARQALEYTARALQGKAASDATASQTHTRTRPEQGEAAGGEDEAMFSEDMPALEDFTAPGMDESFGFSRYAQQGTPSPLRESSAPLSEVPVPSGEGAMRLSYIRYLPVLNQANVSPEAVSVHYRRAAEDVLTQERIPRAYREQVRDYFLAIGVIHEPAAR